MSSEKCLHFIEILNLQENIVITHQILLIKGVVRNPKCGRETNIELSVENTKILSTGLSKDTGKFKFLLDLGTENKTFELKFRYCKVRLILNISYKIKESTYKIQPLLILAADEDLRSDKVELNQQIIDLNLLIIQSVYAEKLKEAIGERLTFVFNDKCKIFISKFKKLEIRQRNEHDLWLHIAKEILECDLGKQVELKFIAFINCSKYLGEEVSKSRDFSYGNIRKHITGHAALGAGGLALFSTTYFYSWPSKFNDILNCFQNQQQLDLEKEPDDSNYRKTRGGVFASSLGAVCHEIGHIFDLGHDLHGVMGSNFDYINTVFTLQSKTEHLPERVVKDKTIKQAATQTKNSFTSIKGPSNGFLQHYREQKHNDSFYFSANSAIILSHHMWLRDNLRDGQSKDFNVHFDKSAGVIKSLNIPIIIVELRECVNSLVKEWFDLRQCNNQPVFEFNLQTLKSTPNMKFYLFLMSIYGHTKKIEL